MSLASVAAVVLLASALMLAIMGAAVVWLRHARLYAVIAGLFLAWFALLVLYQIMFHEGRIKIVIAAVLIPLWLYGSYQLRQSFGLSRRPGATRGTIDPE